MRRILSCALACALAFAPATLSRAASYTITSLDGFDGTKPAFINNNGQVAGETSASITPYGPALYSGGVTIALGSLGVPGGVNYASGINASGQIVGGSGTNFPGSEYHAFLYSNGVMNDLGTLGGLTSDSRSINDLGQVVGSSQNSATSSTAYLYSGGVMTDLNSLIDPSSGWNLIAASCINNSGQIAGIGFNNGKLESFLFSNGAVAALGPSFLTTPLGINSNGQVVGYSASTDGNFSNAFLYYGGTLHLLGTIPGGSDSIGYSVNASGQVVGYALGSDAKDRAFVYQGGSMQDLNTLIDPALHWNLRRATSINDLGQIVGFGTVNGVPHVFLLTPTPEPSSFVLAALGLASLAAFKWRRRRRA